MHAWIAWFLSRGKVTETCILFIVCWWKYRAKTWCIYIYCYEKMWMEFHDIFQDSRIGRKKHMNIFSWHSQDGPGDTRNNLELGLKGASPNHRPCTWQESEEVVEWCFTISHIVWYSEGRKPHADEKQTITPMTALMTVPEYSQCTTSLYTIPNNGIHFGCQNT